MNAIRAVVSSVLMVLLLSCGAGTGTDDGVAQETSGLAGSGSPIGHTPSGVCSFQCRNGMWQEALSCLIGSCTGAPSGGCDEGSWAPGNCAGGELE
jgi:hypothetical protein